MNGHSRICLAATSAIIATLAVQSAQAQDYETDPRRHIPGVTNEEVPPAQDTVLGRARPETDALGVRAGSFVIFPALETGAEYQSNVFRQDTNEEADVIGVIAPSVAIKSDLSRHELNLGATAEVDKYMDNDTENAVQYQIGGDGRLDITRSSNLYSAASYSKLKQDRSADDFTQGVEPTEYTLSEGRVGARHSVGRVGVIVQGDVRRLDFDDVNDGAGGVLNNDDHDRMEYQLGSELSYSFSPGYSAIGRARYVWTDYKDAVDDTGADRDSRGYELSGGVKFEVTGLTYGYATVGYRSQNPEDPAFDDINSFSYGLDLSTNVTTLTTLSVAGVRDIRETGQAGASGVIVSNVEARADHELLRNLILTARAGYQFAEYQQVDRDDESLFGTVGAQYRMTRNFWITGSYGYETRDSTGTSAGTDFDNHVVTVTLRTQL